MTIKKGGRMKCYYIVSVICEKQKVVTLFGESTLDLVWADGQCGAAPVFTNKAKALKWADGAQVLKFEIPKELKRKG